MYYVVYFLLLSFDIEESHIEYLFKGFLGECKKFFSIITTSC
jgi:hypothetical protein